MMNSVTISRHSPGPQSPYLIEQQTIPALGALIPDLAIVPQQADEWKAWRTRVKAYRELRRRQCEDNRKEQKIEMERCAADPAYWVIMYTAIFEPRTIDNNPPAWYPWILFPFQVGMIRWIQDTMEHMENGRGDGVVEKSRDMGASWIFCAYISWAFLYQDVFVAGIISRNADQVDKTNSSDTLFFKIKSMLGLVLSVPAQLRLPDWMKPKGLTNDSSTLRTIAHPTKQCSILGETSTSLAGVGGRATMRVNDEAARFENFDAAWSNQAATTTHRFALSSADLKSPGFRELAELGRAGLSNPYAKAPSYLRLDWWVHPFHTEEWFENEKSRAINDLHAFEREYEISYEAGRGEAVYPRIQDAQLGRFPYDPRLGTLYCVIDPGVRDPTANIWIQEDPKTNRYRVVDGFEGMGGEDVDFIASVLVGVPISGPGGFNYRDYPGLQEIMEWTGSLQQPVIYYGDPYGNHKGGDGKKSFYEGLRDASEKLTGGANVIYVKAPTMIEVPGIVSKDTRNHQRRKVALNKIINKLDFNDTRGAASVLTALKESKYPARKDGRTYSSEILEPAHDKYSHKRSAMEFFAVNVEVGQVGGVLQKSARPVRRTMTGRTIR